MVDHLVKTLQRYGRQVAVVSRGYGGRGTSGVGIVCEGNGPLLGPDLCGDEPYLLARRNPGSLVLIARRRAEGIRLAVERFSADVIVLDDGFQHLAVARNLDVVLLDAHHPFGNGFLLPAGNLREPASELKRADLVVLTRSNGSETPPENLPGQPIRCRHRLADEAASLEGEIIPLGGLAGKRGAAFAGIAEPDKFFASLESAGLQIYRTIAFPDHEAYDSETMGLLADVAREADFLVTTEKDGVKIGLGQFPVPCYQVPMSLEFFDEGSLLLERALGAVVSQEKS